MAESGAERPLSPYAPERLVMAESAGVRPCALGAQCRHCTLPVAAS